MASKAPKTEFRSFSKRNFLYRESDDEDDDEDRDLHHRRAPRNDRRIAVDHTSSFAPSTSTPKKANVPSVLITNRMPNQIWSTRDPQLAPRSYSGSDTSANDNDQSLANLSDPTITLALTHQRIQVLFSDIENLLIIHRTVGVPQIRAMHHLEKITQYQGLLDQLANTQLLSSYLFNKVQRFKLDLELLACELIRFIESTNWAGHLLY